MIHTFKTYSLSVETVLRSPSQCYNKLLINSHECTLLAHNLFFYVPPEFCSDRHNVAFFNFSGCSIPNIILKWEIVII